MMTTLQNKNFSVRDLKIELEIRLYQKQQAEADLEIANLRLRQEQAEADLEIDNLQLRQEQAEADLEIANLRLQQVESQLQNLQDVDVDDDLNIDYKDLDDLNTA